MPAAADAKLLQSCPTLCDPIDGREHIRLPVPGILLVHPKEAPCGPEGKPSFPSKLDKSEFIINL